MLRSVVETCTTLAFVGWIVPALAIYGWRSLRIRHDQMMRLVGFTERVNTLIFLSSLTLLEPISLHLHHFVPDGVASPLPTASLLAWLTANVFSLWCIGMAAVWSRSYLRTLLYLPLPIQTSAQVFVILDSVSQGEASLATGLAVLVAMIGTWTILFVPQMFQTTEEMLCAMNSKTANFAMTRLLSKNRVQSEAV